VPDDLEALEAAVQERLRQSAAPTTTRQFREKSLREALRGLGSSMELVSAVVNPPRQRNQEEALQQANKHATLSKAALDEVRKREGGIREGMTTVQREGSQLVIDKGVNRSTRDVGAYRSAAGGVVLSPRQRWALGVILWLARKFRLPIEWQPGIEPARKSKSSLWA
jgi:hypothetical protein